MRNFLISISTVSIISRAPRTLFSRPKTSSLRTDSNTRPESKYPIDPFQCMNRFFQANAVTAGDSALDACNQLWSIGKKELDEFPQQFPITANAVEQFGESRPAGRAFRWIARRSASSRIGFDT